MKFNLVMCLSNVALPTKENLQSGKVAVSLVNLGNVYSKLGEPRKQLAILERALEILEKDCCPMYQVSGYSPTMSDPLIVICVNIVFVESESIWIQICLCA